MRIFVGCSSSEDVEEIKNYIEQTKDTISNLKSTNDLNTILEHYENDLKNHTNEVKNLQKKIKIRDDKIEDLQYELENANDTIDELEDKVSELQKIVDYFKELWKKFIEFLKDKFFSSNKYDDFINDLYEEDILDDNDIDLEQQPIHNSSNKKDEIDVVSCDRPSLLNCLLEGCYTQSDTEYGNSNSDSNYHFIPNIFIQYDFVTDTEEFKIEHRCAFLNENMTRIIPLQENSLLNIDEISNQFMQDNKQRHL